MGTTKQKHIIKAYGVTSMRICVIDINSVSAERGED